MLVAQGGKGGLGNIHFKSSVNRAPRKSTPGTPGEVARVEAGIAPAGRRRPARLSECRQVHLHSCRIRGDAARGGLSVHHAASESGRVSLGTDQSFVIADIPGLIEGAAEGAGLGIQFLRHVARTSLLLHLVDVAPIDGTDVVEQVRAIEQELEKFDPELLERPRWLVLNKADMLAEDERRRLRKIIVKLAGRSRGSWSRPSPAKTPWRSASRCSVSSNRSEGRAQGDGKHAACAAGGRWRAGVRAATGLHQGKSADARVGKSVARVVETFQYKPVANSENIDYHQAQQSLGLPGGKNNHDTIGMLAVDANGRLAGACTTSGMAWKLHGRVGDSPIIGAGLYVDNEVGGATSTGVGEEVIRNAGSFLVVELMRQGRSPQEACEEAVRRIVKKRPDGAKALQVGFLALRRDGECGAYAIQKGFTYAVCDAHKQDLLLASPSVYQTTFS
jgi:hypothetical protein